MHTREMSIYHLNIIIRLNLHRTKTQRDHKYYKVKIHSFAFKPKTTVDTLPTKHKSIQIKQIKLDPGPNYIKADNEPSIAFQNITFHTCINYKPITIHDKNPY